VRASHAPFVHAVGEQAIVALVLDDGADTDVDRWTGSLTAAGAADVRAVVVSKDRPPTAEDVAGAGGVFVAGGWTPGYQEALVGAGTDWLPRDAVFGGFSAGAAIAGEWAIVGGWRLGGRDVCAEEAGEDLEQLTVRPGLGLVPFAVDVHATQWGTVTRLIHAVRAGLAPEGWAVDEGTALIYDGDRVARVEGLGSGYRVSGGEGDLRLEVTAAAS
jgi:cyanophycinase